MSTEANDHWDESGQIFFHYGNGYGVTENLQNVCLGSEESIKSALNGGKINPNLMPLERRALEQIIDYRKEQGYGNTEPDMVGASPNGTSRGKQKAIRRSSPRERLTLRSSKSKGKGLFRR